MASPITWQNVNGRSLAEAAAPTESASKLILLGFDRLSNTADGYGKLQQTIQNQEEEANVQNFMERLQRARTPEEVAALQASGELDTLRAALKPASLAKVRGAEDVRLQSLRDQITKGQAFQQDQERITQLPIAQQAEVLAAKGDTTGLDALLKSNPNLLNPAKYLSTAKAVVDGDTKSRLEGEKAATQMARDLAQVNLTQAQAADIPVDNARLDADAAVKRFDAATARATATATELNKIKNSTISSPEAMTAVIGNITKAVKEPKQVTALVQQLNTALASDPLFASLPAAEVERVAMQFAGKAGDTTFGIGGDWTAEMKTALNQAYTSNAEGIKSAENRKAQLANLLEEHRGAASVAQRTAYPEWAAAEDEAKARVAARLTAAATEAGVVGKTPTPAQSTQASNVSSPAATPVQNKLEDLARVELLMQSSGELKELSPQVKEYLKERSKSDREALLNVVRSAGTGAEKLTAAGLDLFTLPARAAMGVVNTGIRGVNALGADLPYLPDTNGNISSMTPYSDKLNRSNGEAGSAKELREQLLKEVRGAESKKAK